MFNKFLILIGLKQTEYIETRGNVPANSANPAEKVIPSSDTRFSSDINDSEVTVHSVSEEVVIKALKSWKEIESLGKSIKEFNIVCMDIRDVYDKNERQRIIDFVSGMVHVMNSKLRIINTDGVYLIRKSESNLTADERNRLETLGLYKV